MSSSRYDRQMRLWGERGQQALQNASVLVMYSGPTSAECAKNLILGGVARLTMCDAPERLVEERDAGNNFMVVKNALSRCGGKNNTITETVERRKKRGEMVCEHLRVLNANVEVTFWDEDPRQIVERCFHAAATAAATKDKDDQREANEENGGDYYHRLQEFDIVIASQLDEATTIKLDDICQKVQKKLLTMRSHGCFGTAKISGSKTHCVVEAKPENRKLDLRLSESGTFKELSEYADKFEDLEAMDEQRFAHVPWAVLVLVAKKRFKNSNKTLEDDYEAQKEFKEFLKSMRRTKTELNFEEALENVRTAWQKPEVPENVSECFEKLPREFRRDEDEPTMMDAETDVSSFSNVVSLADVEASDESTKLFWIFVAALEEFSKRNKKYLPLDAGALPDMTSTTDAFVGLQKVYLEKAQRDQREMLQIVKETVVPNLKSKMMTTTTSSAASDNSNSSYINKIVDDIETNANDKQLEEFCARFCKNARDIRFVSFTSLAEERDIWKWESKPEYEGKKEKIASLLSVDNPQRVCAYSYALLRASDAFEAKLCRKAGTYAPEEGVDNVAASSGTEKGKSMLFHRMTSDCGELRALVTKDLEAAIFQSTSPTKMDVENQSAVGSKQTSEEACTFLEQLAWEVVRAQGGEIHAVASVVGGIASQEAIKLITGQFVPSHGRVCVHLADGSSAILP